MNTTDWTATTLSPQARTATHTMSPPLSAEANGKGADVNGMQESPLKNAQVPLKRKEMDQGSVGKSNISVLVLRRLLNPFLEFADPSSTSSTTAGSSSASSKRPKTMKPSSSDGRETLISGTCECRSYWRSFRKCSNLCYMCSCQTRFEEKGAYAQSRTAASRQTYFLSQL